MNLPDDFVKRGLELAKGSHLFGVPLEHLTRDELLAAVAQGWTAYSNLITTESYIINIDTVATSGAGIVNGQRKD